MKVQTYLQDPGHLAGVVEGIVSPTSLHIGAPVLVSVGLHYAGDCWGPLCFFYWLLST